MGSYVLIKARKIWSNKYSHLSEKSQFLYWDSFLTRVPPGRAESKHYVLPLCTTELFQRVQNAAARLIFELVRQSTSHQYFCYIGYPYAGAASLNIAVCTHAVVTGRYPAYLGSIVQSATQSRSGLRPSPRPSFSDFSVPQTRTKFGERAFT